MSLLDFYILRSNSSSNAPVALHIDEEEKYEQPQPPPPQQQQQQKQREFHQIKLTLPTAIEHASHSQQLNSLSLLEQDFWQDKFYLKFCEATKTKSPQPSSTDESAIYPTTSSSNSNSKTSSPELSSAATTVTAAPSSRIYTYPYQHLIQSSSAPPSLQLQQRFKPSALLDRNCLLKSSSSASRVTFRTENQQSQSSNLLSRMQQWQWRLFGSHSNRAAPASEATRIGASNKLQPRQLQHQPINDFVCQLIESQTNTPRLELKRNYHLVQLHHHKQKYHLAADNLSNLTGSALLERQKRATNIDNTDNLSIVSSCISFLDDQLSSRDTTASNCKTKSAVTRMETTNEYSEPFDYFTSLPMKKQSSTSMDRGNERTSRANQPLVLLSSSLMPVSSSASPSSSSSSTSPSTSLPLSSSTTHSLNQASTIQIDSSLSSLQPPAVATSNSAQTTTASASAAATRVQLLPPLNNEYESVRDVRIYPIREATAAKIEPSMEEEKTVEDIKTADTDLFKSTITAFDILSERCSELLGLFDNENESDPPTNRQKESIKTLETKSKIQSISLPPPLPPPPPPPLPVSTTKTVVATSSKATLPLTGLNHSQKSTLQSKFLERTLTFDCHIKSSALLYSSSSSYISMLPSCGSGGSDENAPSSATAAAIITSTTTVTSLSSQTQKNSANPISQDQNSASSTYSFEDVANQTHNHHRHTRSFNSIRSTIFRMAKNEKSLFGKSVIEFLACTHKSREQNPLVLMSNTRQFMNGIKNYLIRSLDSSSATMNASGSGSSPEDELKMLIERERASLDPTQILNLDSIIEDCLQCIVLRSLKARIYYLLVDHLVADHSLILMSKSIKLVCDWNDIDPNLCSKNLGLRCRPSEECLKRIRDYYTRMQCEYAPLVKLKYVLFIVNDVLHELGGELEPALADFTHSSATLLLPPIIYALARCGMYAFQIELEYIWSLVNRQLLTAETLFYLTLMSSACFILRSLEPSQFAHVPSQPATPNARALKCSGGDNSFDESTSLSSGSGTGSWSSSSSSSSEATTTANSINHPYLNVGLLHVYLADDKCQTLKVRCLPIRATSKTRECVHMLAAKLKLYLSSGMGGGGGCGAHGYAGHDDYALFYMENGQEVRVRDDERPFEIKKARAAPAMKFIFRQRSANFLWPKSMENF